MDKRFMKGRLALVAVIAVLCIAIPAAAFATPSNNYPVGSTAQPGVIGVTFTGVAGQTAAITIDGTAIKSNLAKGTAVTGTWSVQDVVVGLVTKSQWVWTSGTGVAGQIKVYGFPTTLAAGSHDVVVTLKDGNGATTDSASWSFTLDKTIPAGGSDLPGTVVADPQCGGACHVGYNKANGMGPVCANCHSGAEAPAHGFLGNGDHTTVGETAYLIANAPTCVACHGSDLMNVATGEHDGCSCHTYGEATALKACQDCHEGMYAPHGFGTAPAHGLGWYAASGHNVDEMAAGGKIGAKTAFDGSQGVTLHWTAVEAFTITSAKDPDAIAGFAPGASFTQGQTGTVTSTWALPTKSVFWPAGDSAAPASAITGLNWNSTIECQDCHTNVVVGGPQGAAGNWGLDAAYPGDYSKAVLTKRTTSGDTYGGRTTVAPSGIAMLSALTTQAVVPNNFGDGTSGANAVICAKCHKLMTVVPAGSGTGTSGQAWPVAVGSNTAHNSHHQDATDNSGQCVNCHIAVPHGWKAPRLLVDAEEGEEYSPDAFLVEGGVMVREGMNSLAGLNNHQLIGADGMAPYNTGSGAGAVTANYALEGTVVWDESQCSACGDHYGEDQKFWNGTNSNTMLSDPTPGFETYSDTAIPVRITF